MQIDRPNGDLVISSTSSALKSFSVALGVLGLKDDADRMALRRRYSELVRRYHPDRNGGDRGYEAKLGQVIEAYQMLKGSRAFAA